MISTHADPDANIIFGAMIDEAMGDQIKISVIATGFDSTRAGLAISKVAVRRDHQYDPSDDDTLARR